MLSAPNKFDKCVEPWGLSAINVHIAFVRSCIPDHKVKTLVDLLKELVCVWGKKDNDKVISIISSTKI